MKIKSLKVTRTINYSPEAYLEYCKEDSITPTQEDFLEFIQDWIYEDFQNENGLEEIEEIED